MKIAVHKIIVVVLFVFSSQLSIAAETPPTPPPPTPPPGLPIDGGIVALFFVALILGYVLSKKYILTKKGS